MDGRAFWSLATNHDGDTVPSKLDQVRDEKDADINVRKITNSNTVLC